MCTLVLDFTWLSHTIIDKYIQRTGVKDGKMCDSKSPYNWFRLCICHWLNAAT